MDPNLEIRKLKTTNTNILPEEETEKADSDDENYPQTGNSILSKPTRAEFQRRRELNSKKVTELQVLEFIHAYLAGTKCSPWSYFLDKSPEDLMELEERADLAGPSSAF